MALPPSVGLSVIWPAMSCGSAQFVGEFTLRPMSQKLAVAVSGPGDANGSSVGVGGVLFAPQAARHNANASRTKRTRNRGSKAGCSTDYFAGSVNTPTAHS